MADSGNEPKEPAAGAPARERGGLEMAPDLMLDLARKAAEILVERITGLPEDNAWDGDFQQALEAKLKENPPEDGRPPAEVIEWVAAWVQIPEEVEHG